MTATSVSRDVYSQVTSGRAFSVSTRRRISIAMVTQARENTAVTASFWRVGMCRRQRSGTGNAMTMGGDGQCLRPELGLEFCLPRRSEKTLKENCMGRNL